MYYLYKNVIVLFYFNCIFYLLLIYFIMKFSWVYIDYHLTIYIFLNYVIFKLFSSIIFVLYWLSVLFYVPYKAVFTLQMILSVYPLLLYLFLRLFVHSYVCLPNYGIWFVLWFYWFSLPVFCLFETQAPPTLNLSLPAEANLPWPFLSLSLPAVLLKR